VRWPSSTEADPAGDDWLVLLPPRGGPRLAFERSTAPVTPWRLKPAAVRAPRNGRVLVAATVAAAVAATVAARRCRCRGRADERATGQRSRWLGYAWLGYAWLAYARLGYG
jgi:hypothetical protein